MNEGLWFVPRKTDFFVFVLQKYGYLMMHFKIWAMVTDHYL